MTHSPRFSRTRRTLLAALAASLAWGVGGVADAQTTGQRKPTLRQRLVAGLRVRRPNEYAYVDAVIDTVNRGELPQKIVDRMFFWARSRAPRGGDAQRPIVYFQPGLNRVAAKLKVTIAADPEPQADGG